MSLKKRYRDERDCKGKIKGGIGWNLSILGPVSRNWYKAMSNLCEKSIYIYIKFCIQIVGLNGSYSENIQPIWKRRYPRRVYYYYLNLVILHL